MKKIVLFILGIFALAGCSEDVYHDIDKQNNGLEVANTASNDGSGGNVPFTTVPGTPPYDSPWNINNLLQVEYVFENLTGDWGSPYLLTFSVTPYVGLAYYDRTNDGRYFGQQLTPGNYPNLYPIPVSAGGSEIGHFIPALPIVVDGTGLPSIAESVVLQIKSDTDHLPLNNVISIPFTYNPVAINFVLPPPPGGVPVTPAEEALLSEYGKVFFYYWQAIDAANTVIADGFLMPDCPYDPAYWTPTFASANIPAVGFAVPLLYNTTDSSPSGLSQELILDPTGGVYPSAFGPFVHNGVSIYAEVKTDATSMSVILRP